MRRRRYLTLTGLAATGTLAGCSGDDSDENGDQNESGNGGDQAPNGGDTGNESTENSSGNQSNGDESGGDDTGDDTDEDTDSENGDDDEPEPAAFEISIDHPDTVTAGESHTVDAVVENTGGQAGTFEGVFRARGGNTDSAVGVTKNVRIADLEPGATETTTLSSITVDTPTTVRVTLGEAEQSYEVEPRPASFEVTNIETPETVTVDEEYTVGVTVENTGGQAGTFEQDLEYKTETDESWIVNESITVDNLGPGESETVETTLTTALPDMVQIRVGDVRAEFDAVPAAPETQTFEGSGQEVRQGLQLDPGLATVEATHDGESNFIVSLVNDTQFDTVLINDIGAFDGAQAALIDGGEYTLDIDASDDWTVSIAQPRASAGELIPQRFEGEGPAVVGPVDISGTVVASAEHDGNSNFIVEILPQQGSFSEVVFNEIGPFEGETTASFNGVGWVDVTADGSWSLEFN